LLALCCAASAWAAAPNDPLFSDQWYLQAPDVTHAAAIDAVGAWTTTVGSSSTVVAVVDSGVRLDHPDLISKLLPGYNFVTNLAAAGGNVGPNADATDPGDYCDGSLPNSVPSLSTWHGTQMAGIIAAATNNSAGVAGINWNAKILPVRITGRCFAYDPDIIAGMRWAAGLSVGGVPDNPNPAQIMNLSFSGDPASACGASYQGVTKEILAKNALIVAAVGNQGVQGVGEPANCEGVLAVTGLNNDGSKGDIANFGSRVDIAAPMGNRGGGSYFSIVTTTNDGNDAPSVNGYLSLNSGENNTSSASAQVAGVASLMQGVHPDLSVAQLIQRIKNSAKPFPSIPGLPTCGSAPAGQACNCTTDTCGAGMLNASGAVDEALRPEAVITPVNGATAGVGLNLSSTGSSAASGSSIGSYQWSIVDDGGTASNLSNADQASATLTPANAGSTIVSLKVTDGAGRTDTTTLTISVAAAGGGDNGNGGGGGNGGDGNGGGGSGAGGGGGGGGGAVDPLSLLAIGALGGLAYAARRERKAK